MPLYPPRREALGFIHMPKTGGSYVRNVLQAQFGWKYVAGGHDPVWYENPSNSPLPVCDKLFGVVRDPWTWYGSMWRYAQRDAGQREELKLWGNGDNSFEAVLYGWTHPQEVKQTPAYIGVIFDAVNRIEARSQIGSSPVGFWSWSMGYFYGNGKALWQDGFAWKIDILLDMRNLKLELEDLIKVPVRVDVDQNKGDWIETSMGSKPYAEWFTPEMVTWVAEADKGLIAEFHFEAP